MRVSAGFRLHATTLPSAGATASALRNHALRVAEKVQAEQRQHPQRRAEPRVHQPADDAAAPASASA